MKNLLPHNLRININIISKKDWIFIFLSSVIFFACNSSENGGTKPQGRGEPGEIILVLDSGRWNGDVGSEFRRIFREQVEVLPRDEPMFDIKHVNPFDFRAILKNAKNLILVVPLNDQAKPSLRMRNFFTQNAIDSMRADQNIFAIKKKNVFATDQQVLFLILHSDQSFIQKLSENKDQLQAYFNNIEEARARKKIYAGSMQRMVMHTLRNKYKFELDVPFGWKVASEKDDFIWMRLPTEKVDKNIFVSFKPYQSEEDFSDENILKWRDEIAKKYIYGDPDNPASYVITEPLIKPEITEVNFNDKYAKKIKGLWKTKNITMGGPFVAYVFVDEALNRLYYIEAFLFSPGEDQREIMRQLDVILKTFKTSSEISS